jgi:hypothetical protein
MAKNLKIGETVFVPRTLLCFDRNGHPYSSRQAAIQSNDVNAYSIYFRTKVDAVDRAQAQITVSNWTGKSVTIHARDALRVQAIGIIVINDGAPTLTGKSMLDHLAEAYSSYAQLLLPSSEVIRINATSKATLKQEWITKSDKFHFAIIIAHGHVNGEGLAFNVDGLVSSSDLADIFSTTNNPKTFISAACYTGTIGFAGIFSANRRACNSFIGPNEALHSSIACHFINTFLTFRLLAGLGTQEAWSRARLSVPDCNTMNYWKEGKLVPAKR